MSQEDPLKSVLSKATAPGSDRALYPCGVVEPLAAPDQHRITLREAVDWFSKYFAYIPEVVAQEIDTYGEQWRAALHPSHQRNAKLFPPDSCLALLYRKATAAQCLYDNLAEIDDHRVLWRSWDVTDLPRRLRSEERRWALDLLKQIAKEAKDLYCGLRDGTQEFNFLAMPTDFPIEIDPERREWLDHLGFETKELLSFIRPDGALEPSHTLAPDKPSDQDDQTLTLANHHESSGLKKIEHQIRAIEAGVDALGFDRQRIPYRGKKQVKAWCEEHHRDLFSASGHPFTDAWKEARSAERVRTANHNNYASGREGKKYPTSRS